MSENNHVVLADDFLQLGQTEEKEFYSVETDRSDFNLNSFSSDSYANIVIRMEAREDTYERTVLSIFDFTGLVGGVFEILEITGGLVVGFFANKLFMFWMLNNLYQVQMKYDEDKEINKYNKGNQNLKRYGMIKRKVRENVKIREESKYPNGN